MAEHQGAIIAKAKAALVQARQLLASDPAAAEAQVRHVLASDRDNAGPCDYSRLRFDAAATLAMPQ